MDLFNAMLFQLYKSCYAFPIIGKSTTYPAVSNYRTYPTYRQEYDVMAYLNVEKVNLVEK
jgi:hypothetical protein